MNAAELPVIGFKLDKNAIDGFNKYCIPDYMREALIRYFENRIEPGGFLIAILTNDLHEAAGHADETNRRLLWEYCGWLYNFAPAYAYGNSQRVIEWLDGGQS